MGRMSTKLSELDWSIYQLEDRWAADLRSVSLVAERLEYGPIEW